MTRAADNQLPIFDRAGRGPLSNPDDEPSGVVGGVVRPPASDRLVDVGDGEASRPDLPDENADGLDDTEEEVRRQAEDLPLDTPGSL